jgi:hypothetical protein
MAYMHIWANGTPAMLTLMVADSVPVTVPSPATLNMNEIVVVPPSVIEVHVSENVQPERLLVHI